MQNYEELTKLLNKAKEVTAELDVLAVKFDGLNSVELGDINQQILDMNDYLQTISENQAGSADESAIFSGVLSDLANSLTIASLAMAAFSEASALNPYVFIATSIISLVASMGSMLTATENQTDAELSWADASEKAAESHKKLLDTAKEKAADSSAELNYYQQLRRELDTLVDANGKIIEGNEERVSVITGVLKNALGEEITITDGMIDNYAEISSGIDKVIEKKRAEAVLKAYEQEYLDAIHNRSEAYKKMGEIQKRINEEQGRKEEIIKQTMQADKRYGISEVESRKNAEAAWEEYMKTFEDELAAAGDDYKKYNKEVQNYDQATADCLNGNFKDIEKTINGTNAAYADSLEERKQLTQDDVNNELAMLQVIYKQKDEMSQAQYDEERARAEQAYLDKQNELFALNNAYWENTDAYAEAVAYMSEQGMAAYDEYGNLTEAARIKLEQLRLTTLELSPEYASALGEMAASGQAIFDENGELLTAAQCKLIDTFSAMNEIDPQYTQTLMDMANDGQAVFNQQGELTTGAQEKLIGAYGMMNNLSPEYSQKLMDMVKNGEAVFDANGSLSEAAREKIKDAENGIDGQRSNFSNSLRRVANEGKTEFGKVKTEGLGSNFVSGMLSGIQDAANDFLDGVSWLAGKALSFVSWIWDEHSPSRKTRKFAQYFVDGLTMGIKNNEDEFIGSITDMSENAVTQLEKSLQSLDTQMIANKMNSSIALQHASMKTIVSEVIASELNVNRNIKLELPDIKGTIHGNIENHLEIDGRETAIQLTPFISEELAFSSHF